MVSCATLSINNISLAESQQTNPHLPFPNSSNSQRSEWESEDYRASLGRALSAMASTATAATCALASPSLRLEGCRAAAAPHCIGLPPPHTAPNVTSTNRSQAREAWKTAAHCKTAMVACPWDVLYCTYSYGNMFLWPWYTLAFSCNMPVGPLIIIYRINCRTLETYTDSFWSHYGEIEPSMFCNIFNRTNCEYYITKVQVSHMPKSIVPKIKSYSN